jgi:hypothetical protein
MRREAWALSALLAVACTRAAPPASNDVIDSFFNKASFRQVETSQRESLLSLLGDPFVDGFCLVVQRTGLPRLDIYMSPEAKGHRLPALKGFVPHVVQLTKPLRPLGVMMGKSTSNTVIGGAGTLGIMVADNSCPTITGYITCNHVATAKVAHCFQGSATDQIAPGTCDRTPCSPAIPIGKVIRRVDMFLDKFNQADAAFVASQAVVPENDCGLCATTLIPADPRSVVGHSILKCGRSTGLTCGQVTGASCIIKIPYGICKEAWFFNQIRVQARGFATEGDSGSVAYTADGKLVGLIFAGDSDTMTFINPMGAVLSGLNVSPILPACVRQPACPNGNSVRIDGCPNESPYP